MMPKAKIHNSRCLVCRHPERARIELLSVAGASVRSLGRKFNVSYNACWRHLRNHLDADRRASLIAGPHRQVERAEVAADAETSVLQHLQSVRLGLFRLFDAAVSANDYANATMVSKSLSDNLLSIAKVSGELRAADAASSSPSPNSGVNLPLDITGWSTEQRMAKMAEILDVVKRRQAQAPDATEATAEADDAEAEATSAA